MPIASAAAGIRHVFLRDMLLQLSIGVHAHEHTASQRVRINVDLGVQEEAGDTSDRLGRVLDYEDLARRVRAVATGGHVQLVETLAEDLAQALVALPHVRRVEVSVIKPEALSDADQAGVCVVYAND